MEEALTLVAFSFPLVSIFLYGGQEIALFEVILCKKESSGVGPTDALAVFAKDLSGLEFVEVPKQQCGITTLVEYDFS